MTAPRDEEAVPAARTRQGGADWGSLADIWRPRPALGAEAAAEEPEPERPDGRHQPAPTAAIQPPDGHVGAPGAPDGAGRPPDGHDGAPGAPDGAGRPPAGAVEPLVTYVPAPMPTAPTAAPAPEPQARADEGLDLWWTEAEEDGRRGRKPPPPPSWDAPAWEPPSGDETSWEAPSWDAPGRPQDRGLREPNGSTDGFGDDLWAGEPPPPRAMLEGSAVDLWGPEPGTVVATPAGPEARAEAMVAPAPAEPAVIGPAEPEVQGAGPNGEAAAFVSRTGRRGQSQEVDDERRSDLSRLARGGAINLVGAFANGAFGFLLVLVITRGFRPGVAGVFFEAIALFTILANVAELGADDGLIRNIPRLRALGRTQDLRSTVAIALGPVIAVGTVFGVGMYLFAPELSRLFVHKADHANALVPYLHVMAAFVPLSAASSSILSATRGFGTMLPTVYVDNFGKPGIRPLLIYGVLTAGLGTAALALAWAGPIILGLAYAGFAMWRLLRRAESRDRPEPGPARPRGSLASEFWRFSAPRGLSAVFSVTVFWLDTLLLGAFKGSSEAGIYTAATRYVFLGFWALSAVQLVIAPMIAGLLTQGDHGRARTLYQTATQWLITPAFPIYLVLATFAPFLLRVFRPQYLAGQDALLILSLAMLVSTAAGPCMVVLLMGGKSTWTLMNSVFALTLNVVLNLLLIPRLGMEGAALAWTASIVANNVAGVIEVWFLLKLTPFSRAFPVIAGASLVLFGGLGIAVREFFGMSLASFAGYLAVATGLFLLVLYRFRGSLHLDILREAVRLRNQRQAARASQVPGRA